MATPNPLNRSTSHSRTYLHTCLLTYSFINIFTNFITYLLTCTYFLIYLLTAVARAWYISVAVLPDLEGLLLVDCWERIPSPICSTTARAIGSIMAAEAVLLIHIDRNQVGSIIPNRILHRCSCKVNVKIIELVSFI